MVLDFINSDSAIDTKNCINLILAVFSKFQLSSGVQKLTLLYCLCRKKNCVIKNLQNNDLLFYKNQNISKEIIKFKMTHTHACFYK